jgi:hypothetical protein
MDIEVTKDENSEMMKNCKGCYLFENRNELICFLWSSSTNNIRNCPCRTCLIKGICQSNCEKFNLYVNTVLSKQPPSESMKL